jgi:Bifunctional DNA primase/polymerase, N-terminal
VSHPWLAAALRYAANGWPVFILGRSKRPLANCANCPRDDQSGAHDPQGCRCLTCHGFYAATRDPKTIARMLNAEPRGMLAIRTGAASGLVVVDVDPAKGGMASLADLTTRGFTPRTRYVRTGSDGLHLYYRHPGPHLKIPGSQSKLAPGIDIKADGGYVAAPPSLHPVTRRPYAFADEQAAIGEMAPPLLTWCLQPDPRPAQRPVPRPSFTAAGGGAISHPDRLMSTLLSRISAAPDGRRRVTLYGCARGAARIVAAGHLTTQAAYDLLVAACDRAGWPQTTSTPNAIRDGFAAEGVHL